ncbi:YdaU family protein [Burkholderia gladioli]|uniref:YdaU family protein n=1 Tax=Burkholderia gladioli TaxID=28095 RepID=UPI001641D74E|nr:YdaU family protein [Burkholderia gladioli]
MNYYERYCGDYQRDTAHLSLMEHGAFTMLLDTYYATEKPLGFDSVSLFRICRAMTPEEQAAVLRVADEFFPVGEDGLRHNKRADGLIVKTRAKLDSKRQNGEKGGRPKGAKKANGNRPETEVETETKTEVETEQKPNANRNESSPTPTPTPVVNLKTLSADAEKRARKKSNDDTDPEFETAWKAFPKREGSNSKQAALGAWRARIREGESGQRLIAAVRAYAAAMTKDGSAGTRYVKQAATFFGPHRHYAEYAPRQDDGSQADLLQEDAKPNGAEWWRAAGFEREWDARNAGVTEKNVKYWRDGRPLIKIPGANVEPWPEGTYERP